MKKQFFPIILSIFILMSCVQSYYVKRTDYLPVTLVSMTDSVKVGLPVTIKIRAEANDGCWSKLRHYMKLTNDNHLVFTAKGNYESYGACPQNIVRKDSVFIFNFNKAGQYYLQLNESPIKITNDTLQIIN